MARFAPVVPTSMALALQGDSSADLDHLGGYHLLLAHDILDKPKEYQRIYNPIRSRWSDSFIILDNSIIELGAPMGIKDLLAASKILKPDCIVIPDVMGRGQETREEATKFVRQYVQAATESGDDVPSLMGVLQGDNVEDVMDTLLTFYTLPLVEYIGIPRILTKMHGSRMPVLLEMTRSPATIRTKLHSFKGFHLLGFSDDILDDVTCARIPWIQGIDSNVPVRAAAKGIQVSLDDVGPEGWSEKTGPRGDFWEQKLNEDQLAQAKVNLELYRGWIVSHQ